MIRRDGSGWEELQAWTDERMFVEADPRLCPATGTTVREAWDGEKACLAPVPLLPEPFDVAVVREVALDCTVGFDARRFSVPFTWLGRRVEVRGCAQTVQVLAGGLVVTEHPRCGREGTATATVLPPLPLGRMGAGGWRRSRLWPRSGGPWTCTPRWRRWRDDHQGPTQARSRYDP